MLRCITIKPLTVKCSTGSVRKHFFVHWKQSTYKECCHSWAFAIEDWSLKLLFQFGRSRQTDLLLIYYGSISPLNEKVDEALIRLSAEGPRRAEGGLLLWPWRVHFANQKTPDTCIPCLWSRWFPKLLMTGERLCTQTLPICFSLFLSLAGLQVNIPNMKFELTR